MSDSASRTPIEAATANLLEAVNASDVERIVSLWADDGVMMPPHHPRVEGPALIRAYFARIFSAFRFRFDFASSRVQVAGDTAWQEVDYTAAVTPLSGGSARSDEGKGLHVFRRQPNGRWLLVVDIWNSDRPAIAAADRRVALTVLPGAFAVSRGAPGAPLPDLAANEPFVTISRTHDELSIVARDSVVLDGFARESGWRCLKVAGPLTFDQIGIVAGLAAPLAAAGVSIFAISTYDTDYLLIKSDALNDAIAALTAAGHQVSR